MSAKTPYGAHERAGEFGQLWIWLSLVLWVVAVAISLAVLVPTLTKAATLANGRLIDQLAALR